MQELFVSVTPHLCSVQRSWRWRQQLLLLGSHALADSLSAPRKIQEPDTLVKKVFAFVRAIDRFTRIPPLWGFIRHESRRWEVNNNR